MVDKLLAKKLEKNKYMIFETYYLKSVASYNCDS